MHVPLWPTSGPELCGFALLGGEETVSLTLYPAPQPDSATVVVCPGGGYGMLADHEGEPVARWLNTLGITGAVLRYRLGPQSRHPMMLQDAARAVRTVRARAGEWGLDAGRVGILGFSAGGHLASTLATHFDGGDPQATDPVARQSSRPDLAVLIYPVITFQEPHAHLGSRANLLGDEPTDELIALLSNETQVTAQTPPTFLVHGADDGPVPVENSLLFAVALSRHRVPYALHVYEKGEHGFGLGESDPVVGTWPALCADWLRGRGF